MDECSYSKEQTISSTESLKANYGHSGSSNDVENLSFDNGSDDQSPDKFSKVAAENSNDVDDRICERDTADELRKQFCQNQYKNIGEGKMDDKKSYASEDSRPADETEIAGGIIDKMLKDDGYGSSNSSPHSAARSGFGRSSASSLNPTADLPGKGFGRPSASEAGIWGHHPAKSPRESLREDAGGPFQIRGGGQVGASSMVATSVISNKSKTPNKTGPVSFPWPTKSTYKDIQVVIDEKKAGVESHVILPPPLEVPGEHRETWERRIDFLLSIIGFAVDLANVWRFPYLCYKNGGGAFLIPYTLMMIFGTVPLFFMELALGQYNRQGPISVWRICPLFKGIGFCAVLVAFYVSFYYNVIIAWALYFLTASTTPDLPWMHCNNSWNTDHCWESAQAKSSVNFSYYLRNSSDSLDSDFSGSQPQESDILKNRFSPASEYFHRAVLEVQWSEGIHSMGYPKWQLVLCLLVVYFMLYLSLFKGVKSSGLVVWVTATMPYAVLTILLIRGLMLPGAFSGISYYLKPELSRLKDTQVWVDAAVQIFFSVGAGFGVHLSYASYNEFHNNCLRDCLITTGVNCFTSFFSGFVIFTYLGFMSHKHGIPISSVATDGPGLVFQVYPEAVSTLPGSNFWSMLFFFMLIMLGVDSAMGGLECIITGLMDEFRTFFKSIKMNREMFTLCAVAISFSVALVNVTPGGIYTFHLLDTYAAGISLLCSALFEAIAVSWFYGLDKFGDDIEAMIGIRPGLYWRICWKFLSPLFIIGVVMFGLFNQPSLQYEEYKYPSWAEGVGWSLSLSSILLIPLTAIVTLYRTKGTFKERVAISISPKEEHEELRRTKSYARFKLQHWLYV